MVFYDTWPKLDPQILLYVLVVVLCIDHIWEIILAKRQQLMCLRTSTVPEQLRTVIPPEIFHRARVYELHKMELFIWKQSLNIIISAIELICGFYPFVWGLATKTLAPLTANELWISLIFVFYLTIYITLRCLPILIYDKCILELRYGTQQRMAWYMYICIGLVAIILAQLALAPLTLLIVFSVRAIGYFFFLYLWLLWALCTLFLVFFLPYLCVPCIGVQRPVDSGTSLYQDLQPLCNQTNFPMSRVFIIRTKSVQYSNAYFYGSCCLKRIVIFDTLLLNKGRPVQELQPFEIGRGLTNAQVGGVVAHELGHWKSGHFYKATLIMKVHFLLTMIIFGLLFHCIQMYEAVGFVPGLCPVIVGFIIVLRFAMTPYLTLANFLMLWNLRRFEYAADRFAHKLGYSMLLRSALVKIYADHMSFPVYDDCYARWHHTHPTILQRLAYQQRLDLEAYLN